MKKFVAFIVAVCLVCATLWSCGVFGHFTDVRADLPDLTSTQMKSEVIHALGYVEPVSELRRLVFKIDGVIGECRVDVGTFVKKNDVLMVLQNQSELAAVALAEMELAVSTSERNQLVAGAPAFQIKAAADKQELLHEHVRHAKKQFDRSKALFDRKSLSEEESDRAETDLIRANKSLQQAVSELEHLKNLVRPVDQAVVETKVQRAEAQLASARQRLADTILTAPFDGTVLEILRREGEAPRMFDREPVIIFADNFKLRVRAEIDERHVSRLRQNQKAIIFGRGIGDAIVDGQLTLIKGIMGPKTVFSGAASERKDLDIVQVLIDLPPDFYAPIGLHVEVDIQVEE